MNGQVSTVTELDVYKKNNKKLEKAVNLEALVFSHTKTTIVARDMTRRDYILDKLKVSKLNETLNALKADYDHQSPTSFHDVAVIQQLSNDLSTLVMGVIVMETEFTAQANIKKPLSFDLNVETIEKRVASSPMETAYNTSMPSSVAAQPQQSSSLLSVRDLVFSNVDVWLISSCGYF